MRKRFVKRGLSGLLSLALVLGLCLSTAGRVSAADVTEAEEVQIEETLEETEAASQGEEDMSALAGMNFYPGDVEIVKKIIADNFSPETEKDLGWNKEEPSSWDMKEIKNSEGVMIKRGIKWEHTDDGMRITEISLPSIKLKGVLDVSGLARLMRLECNENQLQGLNVSGLAELRYLTCFDNQLKELNVSGLTKLEQLHCASNKLQKLDASECTNLQVLQCNRNVLQELKVGELTKLQSLFCSSNQLQGLNVSGCTDLKDIECIDNSSLQALTCKNNPALEKLDITGCTGLRGFNDEKVKVFEVSNCPKLKEITAYGLDKSLFTEGENYDKDIPFQTNAFATVQEKVFGDKTMIEVMGTGRTETSVELAEQMKKALGKEKFDAFILASGADYPDGLGVSALSIKMNAPVLIVMEGTEAKVKDYIKANLAVNGEVIISGETGAVRKEMEDSLKDAVEGIQVKRLGGIGRYDTNIQTIEACLEKGMPKDELLVASGQGFADALSASATGKIIMIVGDQLRNDQKELLKKSGFEKITILGGTGPVSSAVEKELKDVTGKTVERIGGAGRRETADLVAKKYFPGSQASVYTKADEFVDGLAGGLLAYTLGAPMRLAFDGRDVTAAGKNIILGGLK